MAAELDKKIEFILECDRREEGKSFAVAVRLELAPLRFGECAALENFIKWLFDGLGRTRRAVNKNLKAERLLAVGHQTVRIDDLEFDRVRAGARRMADQLLGASTPSCVGPASKTIKTGAPSPTTREPSFTRLRATPPVIQSVPVRKLNATRHARSRSWRKGAGISSRTRRAGVANVTNLVALVGSERGVRELEGKQKAVAFRRHLSLVKSPAVLGDDRSARSSEFEIGLFP